MNDVVKACSRGHEHNFDVCLVEERCWDGDCGRDADLGSLSNLALMAGGNVLLNVVSER